MNVIRVEFRTPRDNSVERVFYFSSMKVLFDNFGKDEIGIGYPWLRRCGLPKTTSKCTITKHRVITTSEHIKIDYNGK